nr:MAG TPA_asm: hypothetical protein [Caudoviricetes sp.]DAX04300.1 MAG TPA: hypothetical protein [Caudoviricetes sp.]
MLITLVSKFVMHRTLVTHKLIARGKRSEVLRTMIVRPS